MPDMKVFDYRAFWDCQNKSGRLELHGLATGGRYGVDTTITVEVAEPDEMRMLVDLLRNENPVFYDRAAGTLETGQEFVGEGE